MGTKKDEEANTTRTKQGARNNQHDETREHATKGTAKSPPTFGGDPMTNSCTMMRALLTFPISPGAGAGACTSFFLFFSSPFLPIAVAAAAAFLTAGFATAAATAASAPAFFFFSASTVFFTALTVLATVAFVAFLAAAVVDFLAPEEEGFFFFGEAVDLVTRPVAVFLARGFDVFALAVADFLAAAAEEEEEGFFLAGLLGA